jgi:Ca2+-binding EF-hand superfamily protein
MRSPILILTFILVCVTAVSAQEGPPQGSGGQGVGQGRGRGFGQFMTFADMDKNKDSKVSRDEFTGPPQFFERVDENKDNLIDEAEWNRVRERMGGGGANTRLSEMLVRFMDANRDTKVSRDEFTRINQVFDALDKDHDGQLSQEELGRFFQALNEVQAQTTGGVEVTNLFQKFDKDKDGKITAQEMNNEKTFKALDINKDNSLTKEEADQALRQLAERSRQQRQAQPAPQK